MEADVQLPQTSVDEECPLPVYETEDKVVAKVATLWGILKQLGFTKERIEECLRAVRALELDDVLDWVSRSVKHAEPRR